MQRANHAAGRAFRVRPFTPDDASVADALLSEAFGGFEDEFEGVEEALARGTLVLSQTGGRLLVAERNERLVGLVRWRDDEGVATLDLLVAAATGAGVALVRGVERAAQDAGIRFLRAAVPPAGPLADYFGRLGYFPVARRQGPPAALVLEKRLPLLTVREQRRADAAAIAALTGEDSWPFKQGSRPGWFVLADGDRVVGVVAARDGGRGEALLQQPVLAPGYEGRGLDLWMLDRAALWASTNGFHTAAVPATPALDRQERTLEDRRWYREGAGAAARYARRLGEE